MVNHLFPTSGVSIDVQASKWREEIDGIRRNHGFDEVQHEAIREDLRKGRIGLSRNRLSPDTEITDVIPDDVVDFQRGATEEAIEEGERALRDGEVGVLSLAAGVGSRWTRGAGVVKAANPFVELNGKHRSFMEIHLAKSRRTGSVYGATVPHVLTTSFLTHGPIEKHLNLNENYGYTGPLYLSPGKSIGMRLVPMVRDLRFLWEELPQETLDENKQKVLDTSRNALIAWAVERGEGSDYVDNVPLQCFQPPGHWYEAPNLLRNGVLAKMLEERPGLKYLMLHNIDTLGANLDPGVLGQHIQSGNCLTFEVIARRIDDRGGGLARVNGRVRLLEGLTQPRESDEFKLRYYNSMTTWIDIDRFLGVFGLSRKDLKGPQEKIAERIRIVAARLPTYVTIKEVKRRWGHGQEDVFPVSQTEKLWSDMTSLSDVNCGFVVVPRLRGQQLKEVAQLDPFMIDGSMEYLKGLCEF